MQNKINKTIVVNDENYNSTEMLTRLGDQYDASTHYVHYPPLIPHF
jgi:nitrate reductase cytochrome c-type subunit